MAVQPHEDKYSFSEGIARFVRRHRAHLSAIGFDAEKRLAELEKSLSIAVQLGEKEDALRAELEKGRSNAAKKGAKRKVLKAKLAEATTKAKKALDEADAQAGSMLMELVEVVREDLAKETKLMKQEDEILLDTLRVRRQRET